MNVVKKKKKKGHQRQTLHHPLWPFTDAFISHLSTFLGWIYLEQQNKGCLIQSFLKFSSGKNLSSEEIIFHLSNDRNLITLWISIRFPQSELNLVLTKNHHFDHLLNFPPTWIQVFCSHIKLPSCAFLWYPASCMWGSGDPDSSPYLLWALVFSFLRVHCGVEPF